MIALLFELLCVTVLAVGTARLVAPPWRGRIFNLLKVYLTVRMVWLLLLWPVTDAGGGRVPAWNMIVDQLQLIDASVFWTFAAIGAAVKRSVARWRMHKICAALPALANEQLDCTLVHPDAAAASG